MSAATETLCLPMTLDTKNLDIVEVESITTVGQTLYVMTL